MQFSITDEALIAETATGENKMLKFTKIGESYIAEGNNGMEYTIELIDGDANLYDIYKKCRVTLRQNGVDNQGGAMHFRDLKVAKDWANKDNDYLALYL